MSPWEKRKRGGLYYTRSRKINGQVIREYIGGGDAGELAAQMDALRRHQREEEERTWRKERERMDSLETPVKELCEVSELLTNVVLLLAGYRQHNRGDWRKKRGTKEDR